MYNLTYYIFCFPFQSLFRWFPLFGFYSLIQLKTHLATLIVQSVPGRASCCCCCCCCCCWPDCFVRFIFFSVLRHKDPIQSDPISIVRFQFFVVLVALLSLLFIIMFCLSSLLQVLWKEPLRHHPVSSSFSLSLSPCQLFNILSVSLRTQIVYYIWIYTTYRNIRIDWKTILYKYTRAYRDW